MWSLQRAVGSLQCAVCSEKCAAHYGAIAANGAEHILTLELKVIFANDIK